MTDPHASPADHGRTVRIATAAAPYLEHWLEVQRRQARVPGVQAAIRVGGELVLSVALGSADLATGEPLTPAHRFRVASHSKTFTATLVLQLLESGALRLDDPLERWVPRIIETAPALAAVTVRALLGHQGGVVRDGRDSDHWQLARPFPADVDGLLGLAADGAVMGSDEHFKYSNVAYGLLGQVVEAAGGAPWADQMAERITGPLALSSTLPDIDDASIGADGRASGHATGYAGLLDDEVERLAVPPAPTGVLAPATGVSSTAEDLTAWMVAHSRGDASLLGGHAQRLAQREESRVRAHDEAVRRFGLGFEISQVGERTLVGHSGGFPGYITRTWCDPQAAVAVSVLTSCNGGPADTMAAGLLRLLDVALAGPTGRADGGDGSGDLERWTGRFASLWGRLDVALLGGRPVLLSPGSPDPSQGYLELAPEGSDALRFEAVDGTGPVGELLAYEWAEDGSVASLRFGGVTQWPVEVFRARRAAMLL